MCCLRGSQSTVLGAKYQNPLYMCVYDLVTGIV